MVPRCGQGTITVFEFTQLVGQVTRMRDAAHDLMARGSLDMPYPYASMIGLLVQIQVAWLQRTVLGMTRHCLAWPGLAWPGLAWCIFACCSLACYAMLCYAMRCYAMRCDAMLCYAML